MDYTDDGRRYEVVKVRTPSLVMEGVDIIVPEAPVGEVAVLFDTQLIPVHVLPLPFGPITANKLLATGRGLYMGHSIKETTNGAGASCDILDGQDAQGTMLCPITLVANESTRDWFPLPGVTSFRGIFIAVNAGSVSGCVYYGIPKAEECQVVQ